MKSISRRIKGSSQFGGYQQGKQKKNYEDLLSASGAKVQQKTHSHSQRQGYLIKVRHSLSTISINQREATTGCCRRRCARPDVSFSGSIHRLALSTGTCLFTGLPPCSLCFSSSSFRAISLSSSSFFRASSSLFASSLSYSGFLIHSFKLGSHRCLQYQNIRLIRVQSASTKRKF